MKLISCDYETKICPNCGNVAKHPHTGLVSSEMLNEDSRACLILEEIDDSEGTTGYCIVCHRESK